ncbi:conserved hypothetical protein [Flavobacterium psychrophilum]|uniref:SMODS domain-containing nucleotidyltransferase n=1 Tax=Flavobacterium psychrophilum TaxID=96345 RepID=UPI000B7C1849|nr:nucleotidyltransferase [Flavobacterium psychrophilum]SNB19997.1 conserved hypothetical protein [Flavobacterium psychrophilum]
MSTSSRFDTFINNIKLSSTQYDDATTKYNNVCKALHNYYYPNLTYNGSTKFLIGSYGKNTAISPPGDIDVIFKIPYATYERFSKNKTGPRGLLNEIKSILDKTFTTTERIKPNGMVVDVAFTTFNIEVLPAFEWTISDWNGTFTVPDTSIGSTFLPSSIDFGNVGTNYGRWKRIEPRKEINELNNSNTQNKNNTKNLVMMMKQWIVFCSVPIKSVVIERLAIEFLRYYEHNNKSSVYYDYLVRDFLSYLLNKENATVFMPGLNENIQIGSSWLSKTQTASSRAIKACEYEAAKKDFDAAYEWKKIFGNPYYY